MSLESDIKHVFYGLYGTLKTNKADNSAIGAKKRMLDLCDDILNLDLLIEVA